MKKNNKKMLRSEFLVADESHALRKANGNGRLRRQIWQDERGQVTRYSLAYINQHHFSADNGRMLGYDNAHGYHHRHYLGKVEPVSFNSFSEIEERFQKEFEVLHEKIKKQK